MKGCIYLPTPCCLTNHIYWNISTATHLSQLLQLACGLATILSVLESKTAIYEWGLVTSYHVCWGTSPSVLWYSLVAAKVVVMWPSRRATYRERLFSSANCDWSLPGDSCRRKYSRFSMCFCRVLNCDTATSTIADSLVCHLFSLNLFI